MEVFRVSCLSCLTVVRLVLHGERDRDLLVMLAVYAAALWKLLVQRNVKTRNDIHTAQRHRCIILCEV